MTILQFIANIKWVIFALAFLLTVVIAVWRMKPETKAEVRKALLARGWKANLPGGFGLEASELPSKDVAAALASDEVIAEAAGTGGEPAPADEVATIRRDAVTKLMGEAAQWGWMMGAQGFRTPPRPVIVWQGDQAVITYGAGTPATGAGLPADFKNPGSGA